MEELVVKLGDLSNENERLVKKQNEYQLKINE